MNNEFEKRINKIIGQLESLKKQISSSDYDCEYGLQQVKVVLGSVKSLGVAMAEDDIDKCLKSNLKSEDQKQKMKSIINTILN